MTSLENILITLHFTLCLVDCASAIICFECESYNDMNSCGSKFSGSKIKRTVCGPEYEYCMTLQLGQIITRSCALKREVDTCEVTKDCKACQEDFCNSSPLAAFSKILIVCIIILYNILTYLILP